ncbi:MAG: hypothetical protein ACYTEO_14910 [Planctomycetota bacterium]|jgi:hypothetical protein
MKKKKKKAKRKTLFKIKEITVGLSGVIPTASFENLRPHYSITVQPTGRQQDPKKIFDLLEDKLHKRFSLIENRAKVDLIERQYSYIRFREKGGHKYPSVTSILTWSTIWKISDDELKQYAARGTVIDKLVELYFQTGKWKDPHKIAELKEEVSILLGGSKGFHWNDCTHEKFFAKYKKRINIKKMKPVIYNDEHLYSGEIDFVGDFDGKRSVMDVKTGAYDMRQLAAYAVCEKGIEQLVVLPVKPTDNITGCKMPVICDTINSKFKEFLKARGKFRERFGI